ncbi:MAG: 16S rRNA (cytosine(1402)-N(4))-methyltransferase RsmH [Rhodobacteraceae bacterium]|nr:16S rRNA (cytosine(1402)-N(4))-methyltransferase RsmH [Paracoccaceae bacterium]
MAAAGRQAHVPVLIGPILDAVSPVSGTWVDGTFGAGGYTRAFLDAGADRVIAIDRDPDALDAAWAAPYGDRLHLIHRRFADMAHLVDGPVDGVVLDLGVSSMQIDRPDRGFSFQADGPLDMRMARAGQSAAVIVNTVSEAGLADILFQYGEEKAARRIARAIVKARAAGPLTTTLQLAHIIEKTVKSRSGQAARTQARSFQALRIAVNDELGQLARGLCAAEEILRPGGLLAVVTFHSLEDRIVKRFLATRSGKRPSANRWAPGTPACRARFTDVSGAIGPSVTEALENPRSRSAKLRLARRTDIPPGILNYTGLGLPGLAAEGLGE